MGVVVWFDMVVLRAHNPSALVAHRRFAIGAPTPPPLCFLPFLAT
jgi:hypothetical protein